MRNQIDFTHYQRAEPEQSKAAADQTSRLPGRDALRPVATVSAERLFDCFKDGAGLHETPPNAPLFSPEEVLIFTEAVAGLAAVSQTLGVDYRPDENFGRSLSLFRLVANLERCVGPRKYRILEICPGGSWFGTLALHLGHSYVATESRPEYYLSRALLLRYFAGEKFVDWSRLERRPDTIAGEATIIPWWHFVGLLEDVSFGVDIVIWREPEQVEARYDIDYALRLSRQLLKTSELGLFLCQNPGTAEANRPLPILDHYERFGFKKSFIGQWCGFVPEELPSDPRLANLGETPSPYSPSENPSLFRPEELFNGALIAAIDSTRRALR